MSHSIYGYGEAPKTVRCAVCTKCKKIQEFEAPLDWRPECCEGAETATAVDLFKSLGKVPKGPLPPPIQTIKDAMLELLSLVEDAEDARTKENPVDAPPPVV